MGTQRDVVGTLSGQREWLGGIYLERLGCGAYCSPIVSSRLLERKRAAFVCPLSVRCGLQQNDSRIKEVK